MKRTRSFSTVLGNTLLAGILSAATTASLADDTDIYIAPNVPVTAQPLVMFSLDYRPNLMGSGAAAGTDTFFTNAPYNLGTLVTQLKTINGNNSLNYFDQLFLSLVAVLKSIPVPVKIGLMMAHNVNGNVTGYQGETPPNNKKVSNGGVILYGFNSTGAPGTLDAFIAKMIAVKKQNTASSSADHTYQGAELFFEFFRYLTGQKVYSGHNGWFDYEQGAGTDASTNMRCSHIDPTVKPACWDKTIENPNPVPSNTPASSPPLYISPMNNAGSCAKIFTINFLFQVSQQDNDANTDAGAGKTVGGLGVTPPNNAAVNKVLEVLRDTDLAEDPELDGDNVGEAYGPPGSQPEIGGQQNVKSFFVSNNSNTTTNGYAVSGGTNAVVVLGSNPQDMIDKLTDIFNQILSVSTTFVAASVPVNVFNRAEVVDNVYFALFQAEEDPRWAGNLKKLRLGTEDLIDPITGEITKIFRIVDGQTPGQPAIGDLDGRILPTALTSWTDNAGVLLNAGDSNGDGVVDAKDSNDADSFADNVNAATGRVTFPTPATGTAANPKDYVTDRDGRHITRGAAGQKIPGFRAGNPGDANPGAGAPPDAGPRRVLYLTTTGTPDLAPLNAAAPTAELKTQLGNAAMTNVDATKLLRYARGIDVSDVDADANVTEARYWLLGDPLHSRPLPINYGADPTGPSVPFSLGHKSKKNSAIFIAMASNDGHLRMFRNTGGTSSDLAVPPELGTEVWSFIPPEGMAVQKTLMDNVAPAGTSPHPYSFDGEPTALVIDQNGNGVIEPNLDPDDSDRVVLYIGLRRGGTAYYALDVTNPLDPKFLWRITPNSRTTTAGVQAGIPDFAELGQTFSRPRIARLKLGQTEVSPDVFETRTRLAVVFGGGYDGGYALGPGNSTIRLGNDIDGQLADDAVGNAIFIVRANDASLIWKAVGPTSAASSGATVFKHPDLKDSIPSNITLVDSDSDGAHDRLYVGDTGGNLWRADLGLDEQGIENPNQAQVTDDWNLLHIACLGRHSNPGCTPIPATDNLNDRRFFHEPDVIQSQDEIGRFDAVVIGSGDRENPLDAGPTNGSTIDVDNWFYMIKDRKTATGTGVDTKIAHADTELTDVTPCVGSAVGQGACEVGDFGWRMWLDNSNGEKVLSAPVTIANSVFFTSYLPPAADPNSCGPGEGEGRLYALRLENGSAAINYNASDDGGSDEPTTDDDRDTDPETPGIPAQVVYLGVPPGGTDSGGGCNVNILAGARVMQAPGCPRFRTFWQREQ